MPTLSRATLASLLLTSALAGCGGGGSGGGSTPPPVNTTPPTAAISSIAPAQRVTNQAVTLTGTGTTPVTNGVLTYSWNFGDGSTASGSSASHTYTTHGDYTVTLTVRDAGNLATSATQTITVVAPPAVPTLSVDKPTVVPNANVVGTASATDPQGSALTYAWDFGDGGTAVGTSASHSYANEGSFVVRVTVTNQFGLSSTKSSQVAVEWLTPLPPNPIILNAAHLAGQTLFAYVAFVEPNGLAYTLDYSFGDGTTARTTRFDTKVAHTYAAAGTYPVRIVATNAAGHSVEATRTVVVQPVSAQPVASDNVFSPYCAGAFCGAASATNYSGSGVGVWRYHNATNADATIDISIGGVVPNSVAALVFSNGQTVAAPSLPQGGTQSVVSGKATPDAPSSADSMPIHDLVLQAKQRVAASLIRARAPGPSAAAPAKAMRAVARAAVPLGTTRTWNEFFSTPQASTVTVAATCPFSTGRNGVIWVDAGQLQRGEIAAARIEGLKNTLCGPDGAYEALIAMHGDVWGPAPAQWVQDGATLQDLNIVVPAVAQSASFNGYFSSSNLNNIAVDPNSNAAVAVVLNGWVFANYPIDDTATRNTLVHELKHLINFYQRVIVRGASHAPWLEETSAMLAEDLVSPRATPGSRTEARVSGYWFSGGGIGYIGWTHPDGQSYNQGGSFGTFLHRRYGASLDRELTTLCHDDGGALSSYQCVQDFITRHGGLGFEDEFARMGASTLGGIPRSGVPSGFGFPGVTVEGAAIAPIGNELLSPSSQPPRDLNGVFGPTTHTYSRVSIAPGQSTYTRNDVVIPAGTTLLLVIAPPAT